MTLQDVYDQTVATDSSTLASVDVPSSETAACDSQPGFVSGSTTVNFVNGTASFTALDPCVHPITL